MDKAALGVLVSRNVPGKSLTRAAVHAWTSFPNCIKNWVFWKYANVFVVGWWGFSHSALKSIYSQAYPPCILSNIAENSSPTISINFIGAKKCRVRCITCTDTPMTSIATDRNTSSLIVAQELRSWRRSSARRYRDDLRSHQSTEFEVSRSESFAKITHFSLHPKIV